MKNKKSFKGKDSRTRTGKRTQKPDREKRPQNSERERRPQNKEEDTDFEEENLQLEGRRPVLEAIENDLSIDKIFILANEAGETTGTLRVLEAKAKEKGFVVVPVTRNKLNEISQTGNHQGVVAYCPPIQYVEVSDMIEKAKSKNQDPFIVILDGITDPHNLGAIIRSAESSGVHGVIIPKRRAVGVTGVVSKTSAGAINHISIARVTNLNNTIEELKKAGLWIASANMDGEVCYTANLKGPIALVIGSEGFGVSRLVKENSDFSINVPMYGQIDSLNASVAAGILMYEVVRQRNFSK